MAPWLHYYSYQSYVHSTIYSRLCVHGVRNPFMSCRSRLSPDVIPGLSIVFWHCNALGFSAKLLPYFLPKVLGSMVMVNWVGRHAPWSPGSDLYPFNPLQVGPFPAKMLFDCLVILGCVQSPCYPGLVRFRRNCHEYANLVNLTRICLVSIFI